MKTRNLQTRLGLLAVVVAVVGLTGCSHDSGGTPPAERKAGQDISPEARADKKGDVPTPGSTTPGGK